MSRSRVLVLLGVCIILGSWVIGVKTSPLNSSQSTLPRLAVSSKVKISRFPPQFLRGFLKKEANQIGKLEPNPEEKEKKLKELVQTLRGEDFQTLSSDALDLKLSGDERYLSSYLLSLAQDESALGPIEKLAEAQIPDLSPDSPLRAIELSIRAQALEGFENFVNSDGAKTKLIEIIQNLSDPFLVERAQHILYNLNHPENKKIAQQDQEALKGAFHND